VEPSASAAKKQTEKIREYGQMTFKMENGSKRDAYFRPGFVSLAAIIGTPE
jgi:hypothetical protein